MRTKVVAIYLLVFFCSFVSDTRACPHIISVGTPAVSAPNGLIVGQPITFSHVSSFCDTCSININSYSWSAPGATLSTGTGENFSCTFNTTGTKTITLTVTCNTNYSGSANREITVSPEGQVSLTMNLFPEGGGSVTPAVGDHYYNLGTEEDITAEANVGYHFTSWTGDIGEVDNANSSSTTITMNGSYSIQANFASYLVKGPYLIYEGNIGEMTVLWQTDETRDCTLQWYDNVECSDPNLGSQDTTENNTTDHQHEHVITGLTPGALYYYRVVINNDPDADPYYQGSFRAAPANVNFGNVKMLTYGDTRNSPYNQNMVTEDMIALYTADPDYQTIITHMGDWVNSNSESSWDDEFFNRSYSNNLEFQANVPINGCKGNHEGSGSVFEKYWPYPYVNNHYWSFDYGPVHIAIVDEYTDYSPGSAQGNWLANDLDSTNKEWKIIVMHEPGWSAGGHGNKVNVQDYIQPLCETYGVDLVLCGHNHYYARCVVNDVHHITLGGGGAPLGSVDSGYPYVVAAESTLNFGKIDVQGYDLTFEAIRVPENTVIETFTIHHMNRPSNLVTTATSPSLIVLQWTDNSDDETGFKIERKTGGGSYEEITTVGADETSYTDNGLTSGLIYTYRVRAYNNEGNSHYSNIALMSPLPGSPSALTATAYEFSVSLDWEDSTEGDFAGYNVYRSLTSGDSYSLIHSGTSSVYTDSEVTKGTSYYYVVKSTDSFNESGSSNEAKGFPRDYVPPAAPSGLSAIGGDQTVTLTWFANSEEDLAKYKIYRSKNAGGPHSKIAEVTPPIVSYPDTGLIKGTNYYYEVTAIDTSTNESLASVEANATPFDRVAPPAISNLSITRSANTIILDWTDSPVDDLAGYLVYRGTTSGFTPSPGSLIADTIVASQYLETTLPDGTSFYYVVKVKDTSFNESLPSNEVSADDKTPPSPPVGLIATASEGQVDLSWTANSDDFVGYNIYRSEVSGTSYSKLNSSTLLSPIYVDTSVTNGTTYYYVVKAIDGASNESSFSDEKSAKPEDITPPVAPTGLICTQGITIVLDWDDNNVEPDFAGYNVYRGTTSGSYVMIASGISTSTYTDQDVNHGTTYYYVVKAIDESLNTSAPSNEVFATAEDGTAPTPNPLTWESVPTATSPTSITMTAATASDPSGVEYYFTCTVGGGPDSGWIDVPVYEATGLTELTSYTYTVKAKDKSVHTNETAESTPVLVTTPDGTPPSPAPVWEVSPNATGIDSISMTASESIDPSDVEYYFNCISGGGNDSGWQNNRVYVDTGLAEGHQYTYTVYARDKSSNKNETIVSAPMSATTLDQTPPTPNQMTWTVAPHATGAGTISMTASIASDVSGVEYYFTCTTGGGNDSGWISIPTYEDSGLIARTEYTYTVIARDTASPPNSNIVSLPASATTKTVVPDIIGINKFDAITSLATVDLNVGNVTYSYDNLVPEDMIISSDPAMGTELYVDSPVDIVISLGNGQVTVPDVVGMYQLTARENIEAVNLEVGAMTYSFDASIPVGVVISQTPVAGSSAAAGDTVDMVVSKGEEIIYVNTDVVGGANDGLSWSNAFRYLQDALSAAGANDQIWVAKGTYYPDENTDNPNGSGEVSTAFQLKSGVAVYGGFSGDGTETILEERDLKLNPTILSGDIDGDDLQVDDSGTIYYGLTYGGNSYHVVKGADGAILDGFTITGGCADDNAGNGGGGMFNNSASPTVRNCRFLLNVTRGNQQGGGLYSTNNSSPKLINCLFSGNFSRGNNGGAVFHGSGGNLELINCSIANNSGDGIHCDNAAITIENCIVWQNRTVIGSLDDYPVREIYLSNGAHADISYSNIETGQNGIILDVTTTTSTLNWLAGNDFAEPKIANWGLWDWRKPTGADFVYGDSFTIDSSEITIRDLLQGFSDVDRSNDNTITVWDFLISDTLDTSGSIPKPYFDFTPQFKSTCSGVQSFDLWFNNDAKWNGPINTNMVCTNAAKGIYRFDSDHFFPVDDDGFSQNELEVCHEGLSDGPHNYYFTLEYHTESTYLTGQILDFKSSDDLFVAINEDVFIHKAGYWVQQPSHTTIVLKEDRIEVWDYDLGLHTVPTSYSDLFTLDPSDGIYKRVISVDLRDSDVYDFHLFWAQRHPAKSVLLMDVSYDSRLFFKQGDYHLQDISPCIDAGDNDALPVEVEIDIESIPRFVDDFATPDTGAPVSDAPYVDMGAYEYVSSTNTAPIVEAGSSQTINFGNDALMSDASFSDDGWPVPPGEVSLTWSHIGGSGTGSVQFWNSANEQNPTVTFTEPGTYILQLLADDGDLQGADTVTITVIQIPPELVDDLDQTDEDVAVVIDVLSNDYDLNSGDVLTIESVTQPSNGIAVNNTTDVTYTPNANWFGQDSFTYTATDGAWSVTATVTVTVIPVPDRPVAVDDSGLTYKSEEVVIDVIANDTDVDAGDILSVHSIVSPPANGQAVNNSGANITYTPDPGFSDEDTFTYLVKDSASLVSLIEGTVTVTVINRAPVADDDSAEGGSGETIDIAVLENDQDPDGDALSISSIDSAPANGQAVINGTNITYTPNADFSGIDTFTYIAQDNDSTPMTSNSATVTVTVFSPLVVDAGKRKETILPALTVPLDDADVSGGHPTAPKTFEWSIHSLPPTGSVDFDTLTSGIQTTSEIIHPTVQLGIDPQTVDETGVDFVLKLYGTDGYSEGESYVMITVYPAQTAPKVIPGDYGIGVNTDLPLKPDVTDDGKPYNGYLSYKWTLISYPIVDYAGIGAIAGEIIYNDQDGEALKEPVVRFTQPGPYLLKLEVSDGDLTGEGYANVNVTGLNTPPVVDAGEHAVITPDANEIPTIENPYELDFNQFDTPDTPPSATDSDLPPQTLGYSWDVYGPVAGAYIDPINSLKPTVTFTKSGTYVFTLTVNDGYVWVDDEITIVIGPDPEVYAGENKNKTAAAGVASVDIPMDDAWAKENALPMGNMEILWSAQDTRVSFDDPASEQPTVTVSDTDPGATEADIVGSYKLTLSARDTDGTNTWISSDVWISVTRDDPDIQLLTKKSVYICTSHGGLIVKSFEIDGDTLVYEGVIGAGYAGAAGAVTVSDKWEKLFIGYEGPTTVSVISAKDFSDWCETKLIAQNTNPSAIIVDDLRERIYVGGRSDGMIYVYIWDELSKNLFHKWTYDPQLERIWGMALDEVAGLLYVTDYSSTIRFYDVDNEDVSSWHLENSVENIVGVEFFNTMDIDLHILPDRTLIYTGGFHPGDMYNHSYLVQIDTANSSNNDKVDAGTVIGLAVDQDTGYVYCTTRDSSNDIKVFNSSLGSVCTYDTTEYSGAGVAVGSEMAYEHPFGTIEKTAVIENAYSKASPVDDAKDEITYSIRYTVQYVSAAPGSTGIAIETYVVDHLPRSLDFVEASHQGQYDPDTREIRWYIGDVSDGATNTTAPFTFKAKVNEFAKPGGTIENYCEIDSLYYASSVTNSVDVVWWVTDENRLYVDNRAPGGSGLSWDKAYRYLDEAISHASESDGIVKEIWVAGNPDRYYFPLGLSFTISEPIAIYGGFAGNETDINQRVFRSYENETILHGGYLKNYVVKLDTGADNAIIDGFTIRGGVQGGVFCSNASPRITNCIIEDNYGDGIHCSPNTSPVIKGNIIRYNELNESFYYDAGIHCRNTDQPKIINNLIHDNTQNGIYLNYCGGDTVIRNNTIVNNGQGIHRSGGSGDPYITNCIIWAGYDSLSGTFGNVSHSCIEDANYPTDPEAPDINGNFYADPLFSILPDDYHLQNNSPCKSKGTTTLQPFELDGPLAEEVDIDGEPRLIGTDIEIGADEYPAIKAYAGGYLEDTLPAVADPEVDVTFANASLTEHAGEATPPNMRVEWELVVDPSTGGIDWNGQASGLNPTVTFSESGLYLFKLTAYKDEDGLGTTPEEQIGSDYLVVQIYVGVEAVSTPAQISLPDKTVDLTCTVFGGTPVRPDKIKWYGDETVVKFGDYPGESEPIEPDEAIIATFSGGQGLYHLQVIAYDSDGYAIGEDRIVVPVGHQQVEVTITADKTSMTWPENTTNISANISGATAHKVTWIAPLGAEQIVKFGGNNNEGINDAQTYVTFAEWGTFQLGFHAEDEYGDTIGTGQITINVNSPDFSSLIISAGDGQTVDVPYVFLTGNVDGDDGLALTYEWLPPVDDNGDALATFIPSDANTLAVKADFNAPVLDGNYTFGLLAKCDFGSGNGLETVGIGEVTVTVGSGSGYLNPVIVDPGTYGDVTLLADGSYTLTLSGNITDNTVGSLVDFSKSEWVCYSGQGNIIFNPDPAIGTLIPDVTFTATGPYQIGLIAKDVNGNELALKTTTINVYSFDGDEISATLTANKTDVTLFIDGPVDLTAIVSSFDYDYVELVEATGSVEFSEISFDFDAGEFGEFYSTATFHRQGAYRLQFKVIREIDQIPVVVGQGEVDITVNLPDGLVTATAAGLEEYAAVYTGPLTGLSLNGIVSGISLPVGVTYDWTEVNPDANVNISHPDDSVPNATVDISASGVYELRLAVMNGAQEIGADVVNIILPSGDPLVSAGRHYPRITVGETLHLEDAFVYDDTPVVASNIFWTCVPSGNEDFNYASPYSKENPGVCFLEGRRYTLTIAYETVTDSVDIVVDQEPTVYAGNPKDAIVYYPLLLDGVIVAPSSSDFTYEWDVESGPAADVEFSSVNEKEPEVTFESEGPYKLMLRVWKNGSVFGSSQVDINVKPNPIQDTDTPEANLTAILGETEIVEDQTGVHGDITITVDAIDENIDYIELKVIDTATLDETLLPIDSYQVLGGTTRHPTKIGFTCVLDKYYDGYITLQATAFDKYGKSGSADLSFTSTHKIQSFSVSPQEITTGGETLYSNAVLNTAGSLAWNINIYKADDIDGTSHGSTSGNGSTIPDGDDNGEITESSWSDGSYAAKLTVGVDSAVVNFDVIKGGIILPIADISNLNNGEDWDEGFNPQSNPLPKITEGLFLLEGQAGHDVFPDDVSYKIEIFDNSIKDYTFRYDYENRIFYELDTWKEYPSLIIKNVTPDSNPDGYYYGSNADDEFGQIDLTDLPNGAYQMLLTVECRGQAEYDRVEFALETPLKIGNVKFSQEDMVIPIGGYPLRVVRTYDSFNRNTDGDDFGHGWTFEFANMDIKLNERRSGNDTRIGGDFDRDVTLTMPDGKRVTYVTELQKQGDRWYIKYQTPDGVDATLTPEKNDRVYYGLYTGYFWENDIDAWKPSAGGIAVQLGLHDISGFKLTADDGTVYKIMRPNPRDHNVDDQFSFQSWGQPYLDSIDTLSGERFEFASDGTGVTYKDNSGEELSAITIDRHPSLGYITAIWAPRDGDAYPSLKYVYDESNLNLEEVWRLVDDTTPGLAERDRYDITTYVYEDFVYTPDEHYITEIKGPRGLSPIRYIYDDQGKLIAIMDAKDNTIEVSHDIIDSTETVTDRSGNKTVYSYNDRGNVELVERYDKDGGSIGQTDYTYDGYTIDYYDVIAGVTYNNIEVYSNVYTDKPCMVTGNDGNKSYTQYDDKGRALKETDSELNITEYTYDDATGNVLTVTQKRPKRNPDGSILPDVADKVQFEEISTTRNAYNDDNILIFSGTTTGSIGSLQWHSLNVNYYTNNNYIKHTVQIDVNVMMPTPDLTHFNTLVDNDPSNDDGALSFFEDTDESSSDGIELLAHLSNHMVTSYSYSYNGSGSYDQPYSITDPSGRVSYFYYDENGNQFANWHYWDDVSNNNPIAGFDSCIITLNHLDAQGRTIKTRRIVQDISNNPAPSDPDIATLLAGIDGIVISENEYNSIGKVDYSIDGSTGILIKYLYDELGNMVETLVYESYAVYDEDYFGDGSVDDEGYPINMAGILSITKTLYDVEGRTVVSVGSFTPGDSPMGSETVYDALGRVEETRQWANVNIDFSYVSDFISRTKLDGTPENVYDVVYVTMPSVAPQTPNIKKIAANAWKDTVGTEVLAWTSDGKIPLVASAFDPATQIGPKSYSRTIYDGAGRAKHSVNMPKPIFDPGLGIAGGWRYDEYITTYHYDNAGKQIETIDPQGHIDLDTTLLADTIALYGYTSDEPVIAKQRDYSGFVDSSDVGGNLTGTHITSTFYVGNRRDAVMDAGDNETSFTYDDLGRVITTTYPPTRLNDDDGDPGTPDDDDGDLEDDLTYTHVGYDGLGRKVWESEQTEDSYSTVEGDLAAKAKQFGYDAAGRLIMVVLPKPDLATANPIYRYYYDAYGNQIAILDPVGKATLFEYDHLNRQTVKYMPYQASLAGTDLTDPTVYPAIGDITVDLPGTQKYEQRWYDPDHGRVEKLADYEGNVTIFYYYDTTNYVSGNDVIARPGQLRYKDYFLAANDPWTDPETKPVAYPDAGSTIPDSRVEYTYDTLGRKVSEYLFELDSAQLVTASSSDYTYDASGRVESVISQTGKVNYEYSSVTGRKTATWTGTDPALPVTKTEYTYDEMGRLYETKLTWRDGADITDEVTSYDYTDVGSRDSITLPNGVYTQYSYNAINRLDNVTNYDDDPVANPSAVTLSSFAYTLKANGMRATADEVLNENRYLGYEYDNLNRLCVEKSYDASTLDALADDGYTTNYEYDLAGNRKKRQVVINQYPDEQSPIEQILSTTYHHDPNTDRLMSETNLGSRIFAYLPYGDNRQVYAYADGSGGITYKLPGSDTRIGQFAALFTGLPSVFNAYLFYILAGLLGVFVIWPIPAGFWHRLRFGAWPKRRSRRLAVKRFICLLMAFVFLAGPESFLTLSRAQIQYSDLSAAAWGNAGDTITYEYDDNGSLTSKETSLTIGGEVTERVDYTYNLQNRLETVTTTPYTGGVPGTASTATYKYNLQGIRVSKDVDGVVTSYLIDPYNHTGYAQVLEETTDDGTTTLTRIHYTIGDDVISQTESTSTDSGVNWTASDPQYLLYDGHGSTRQLADPSGTVAAADNYSYDAYGIMLSDGSGADAAANAGTKMLYAGEQYDPDFSGYYNRARYYNPSNGTFNRTDPYSGSAQDPQSLHKYAYCHANPVNAIDPTGMMGDFTLVGTLMVLAIMTLLMRATVLNAPVMGQPTYEDDSGELVYDLGWSLLIVVGGTLAAKLGGRLIAGAGTRLRKLVKWPRGFKGPKHFKDVCKRIVGTSGADDVVVGIRGSSVTNKSFTTGTPFGPGKDLDLFVVSDDLYGQVVKAGAKTNEVGLLHVSATKHYHPELHALEKQLTAELGRKTTFRIYSKEGFKLASQGGEKILHNLF